MKKRLAFLTAALALVCMVQAQPFRYGGNGEFTVMQLTDLHYNGAGWQSDHIPGMLVRLIESEKPDLVVVTGDLIYAAPGEPLLREICGTIASTDTPYAVAWGNHDAEQGLTHAELNAIARTLPKCVNGYYASDPLHPCDFVIPVLSKDGSREEARLYVMDSNDYNADDHSYKGFTPEQVAWYRATADEAAKRNGYRSNGLMFFHIPLNEYAEAFDTAPVAGSGFRLERECPPRDNTGMFRAAANCGEIIGIFAGHDHSNNYIAEKEGIDLNTSDITFDTSIRIVEDSMDEASVTSTQKLMVYVAANELDSMITDFDSFQKYANSSLFYDLRDILTEEQLQALEPYFYYVDREVVLAIEAANDDLNTDYTPEYPDPLHPEEMQDPIPVGICLTGCTDLTDNYYFRGDGIVMGIYANAEHADTAVDLAEYLLSK